MVALVVILAAIISSLVMGLWSKVEEPTLTAFKVETITDADNKYINALRFTSMAGDEVSGKSGGSAGTGLGNKLDELGVVLGLPDGKSVDVSLCAAQGEPLEIKPGSQFYVVKRENTFFLVTDPTQKKCGGGGGGGSGSGGADNKELLPHGSWKVIISDKLRSNTVIYSGTLGL